MSEVIVSQADIQALSRKMGELGDVLTEKEQTLLLAVFKLAGEAISSRMQGQAGGIQTEAAGRQMLRPAAASSLSKGFVGAFEAIGAREMTLRPGWEQAAGGVGIGVVW